MRAGHAIAHESTKITKSRQQYSTLEEEMFIVIHCQNHLKNCLLGTKFVVLTSHK